MSKVKVTISHITKELDKALLLSIRLWTGLCLSALQGPQNQKDWTIKSVQFLLVIKILYRIVGHRWLLVSSILT